jgi:hypothetical protein
MNHVAVVEAMQELRERHRARVFHYAPEKPVVIPLRAG